MSTRKRTIPSVPVQQHTLSRPQSGLDWNVPRKQRTPPTAFKPILFNQKDVALMIRVAAYFGGASFACRVGETEDVIDLCADLIGQGCCEPGAAILEQLNLRRVSGGYAWDPQ